MSDAAESARDFQRNTAGVLRVTKRGLRNTYETLRGIGRSATRESATLIREAEREYTSRARTDTQREAIANLINGQDGMRRDVEAIEALEDVYTGDQDPEEGISNLPDNNGSGIREGDSCDSGYQEFPLDDETSTCVFASLVEPNCYAGSRRVDDPDLGNSSACLYYQLDFFQPGGGCRPNYSRVQFQGRETCRWAELGADQVAWYTLRKGGGEPPPGEWGCLNLDSRSFCDCRSPAPAHYLEPSCILYPQSRPDLGWHCVYGSSNPAEQRCYCQVDLSEPRRPLPEGYQYVPNCPPG